MTSQKNGSKEKLAYFFEFINFSDSLNFDNLVVVAMAYIRFAYMDDPVRSKEKYEILTSPAFDNDNKKLNTIKSFIDQMQVHFQCILDKIIGTPKSSFSLSQTGVRTIKIEDGSFMQFFQVKNTQTSKLNFKSEKPHVEAVFINILINGSLLPDMFNKCDECGNYFYQKTRRTGTKFCSPKCSNLNRQKRFHSHKTDISKKEFENIENAMLKRRKKLKNSKSH